MRKTTLLLLASVTLAVLASCTTAMLMAAQGVAQTATVTLVGAGDIAECSPNNNAKATAALLDNMPGTVLTLGDNAYPDGTPRQYANCYITTNSPMAVSSMLPAPTGGASTKLARCL